MQCVKYGGESQVTEVNVDEGGTKKKVGNLYCQG